MKITIRNDWHSTEHVLEVELGERIDPETAHAILKRLCPDEGCHCYGSSPLGHRGPQPASHYFYQDLDGSVTYAGDKPWAVSPAEKRMREAAEAERVEREETPEEEDEP